MKGVVYFGLLVAIVHASTGTFVNTEVERNIDLNSHLVKIKTKLTIRNDGNSPASTYQVAIDPVHAERLSFISVRENDEGSAWNEKRKQGKEVVYEVTLPKSLKNGAEMDMLIEEVYSYCLTPFPEEITQNQKQLVKYAGNHLYYSLYATESQTTNVELASTVIKDNSKYGTTEADGNTIKYGGSSEYENVAAKSQNAMSIHFENNNPFLAITRLERVIEVSHWGNIAVEETLDIRHIGAKLKGSFSRFDYQRLPNSGISAVKSFKSILPSSASDVYYRDEIGNISTSNLLELDDSVELEIRPRFPIFGGWKTHYYIGYNLPSYNYLFTRGDLYALKMRFVDHVYDDQLIDELIVKVILPEGCKHLNVENPYGVNRGKDSLQFTYLDTSGRPVITLKKSNLVEGHIQDFTVSYTFNKILLLREPMLVVSAFFLLFFTVIIFVRLDFSITHDKLSETKMRVQCVIEKMQAEQAKRSCSYNSYASAIKQFKASKSSSDFANSKKKADRSYNEATKAINVLVNKLKEDGASADVMEKVHQMMSSDQLLHDKYTQSVTLAEKLVSKKLNRDQYLDLDGKNQKSIEDLQEKLDGLTDNL